MKQAWLTAVVLPVAAVFMLSGCGEKVSSNERLNRASAALKENKLDTAASELDAVLKDSPNNCSARLLQALQYEKQNELDKAIDVASSAAKDFPDSFAALYTCGRLQSLIPIRRREAYDTLERALKLNPQHTETLVLLCNIGSELNKDTLKYLLELRGKTEFANNHVLTFQLGKSFLQKGNRRNALIFIRNAMVKSSDPELIFRAAQTIDTARLNTAIAISGYKKYLQMQNRVPERSKYAEGRLKVLQRSGRNQRSRRR